MISTHNYLRHFCPEKTVNKISLPKNKQPNTGIIPSTYVYHRFCLED